MIGTGGFLQPEEIIKQLNIKKGMQVADFGCGAGYFVIPLAKTVGEGLVYAFDVLEQALESVRSRAKLQGLFNIETKRCNLEIPSSSGLPGSSLDMVLLANILFQSSKKIDIIKEAKRVLRKGGELVIIDWQENQPMGPPKELIVALESIKKMVQDEGLIFKKEVLIDKYHWGMVFQK
jgi:ubiquinone/menaquinone biosynthesis C-methylase UbiE